MNCRAAWKSGLFCKTQTYLSLGHPRNELLIDVDGSVIDSCDFSRVRKPRNKKTLKTSGVPLPLLVVLSPMVTPLEREASS